MPPAAADAEIAADALTHPDAAEELRADSGTGSEPGDAGDSRDSGPAPDAAGTPDSGDSPDAEACTQFGEIHDTYAQAMYFDGTYGPLTGTITTDQVLAGVESDMEFWHGHGGVNHHFILTPDHFAQLARGERVTLLTTEVDSHQHELFIDPTDPGYRVPGSPSVMVPLC